KPQMGAVENADVFVFKSTLEQRQPYAPMRNVRNGSDDITIRGKVFLQASQQLKRMSQVLQEVTGQNHVEALRTESLFQRESLYIPDDDTRTIALQVWRHSRVALYRDYLAPTLAQDASHSPCGGAQFKYRFAWR